MSLTNNGTTKGIRPIIGKFENYKELSSGINIPVRQLRTLVNKKIIPVICINRRVHLFDRQRVLDALSRFEIREVA